MILKLKVLYDEINRKWHPTQIFHVHEFVDYYALRALLSQITEHIRNTDLSSYVNHGEIHFRYDKTDHGYVSLGPSRKSDFTSDDLIGLICCVTGMTKEDIFNRSRQRRRCIPRAVIFTALNFYANLSYSDIGRSFGYHHASVMHNRRQTLPSTLLNKEPLATRLVEAVVERYGDDRFYKFAREFNFKQSSR